MKKINLVMSLIITVIISSLVFTGVVEAEESIAEKKAKNTENLSKVEEEIVAASKKLSDLNTDIQILENTIKNNNEHAQEVEKEISDHENNIKKIQAEIDELEKEIEARNDILKDRLLSYQNTGGDAVFMEVIFGSVGFEEFISRFTAVNTITAADNKLVEDQEIAISKVEKKQNEVTKKLEESKMSKLALDKVTKIKTEQKEKLEVSMKSSKEETEKLKAKKARYVADGNDISALENRIKEEIVATESEVVVTPEPKKSSKETKVLSDVAKNPVTTKATAVAAPASKESPSPSQSAKTFTMQATAYTADCAGCSGITATGINLKANRNAKVVAVDPSVIPLGSKVWVSGYGVAVAGDTGGAIKGMKIDLHYPNKKAAYAFGRGTVTVKILK